jgi:hypothetical protein
VAFELRDARRSGADREWLTNVYPFYLHDLSEFDLACYTLDDRGVWMPDPRAGWLEEDDDHPLILVEAGRRVGFALVNQAPSPRGQASGAGRSSRSSIASAAGGRSPSWPATRSRSASGAG